MKNVSEDNKKVFWLAPIVVLAIGIFPLPIGYYTLSRLVVCASAIYFAYNFIVIFFVYNARFFQIIFN